MTDIVDRLRARADEQDRCNSYPIDRAMDREAADEIERLRAAAGGDQGGEGTEWFWRIVDAYGLADVPSDEGEALRLILRRGGFAGGERGGGDRLLEGPGAKPLGAMSWAEMRKVYPRE